MYMWFVSEQAKRARQYQVSNTWKLEIGHLTLVVQTKCCVMLAELSVGHLSLEQAF